MPCFKVCVCAHVYICICVCLYIYIYYLFFTQLCNHVASGKKCQYVGNCSFAHSPEEREVWTYMKDNRSKFVLFMSFGFCEVQFPMNTASSLHGFGYSASCAAAGWNRDHGLLGVEADFFFLTF